MSVLEQIKHYLASKVIVREKVDEQTADWRFEICLGCEFRDPEENKCRECGCYLDLKVGCRVNWLPKKNRNEVTHCPLGKWNDLEIANEYRRLDGLELLT